MSIRQIFIKDNTSDVSKDSKHKAKTKAKELKNVLKDSVRPRTTSLDNTKVPS